MHTTGWVALGVAAVFAVIDWVAVARRHVRLEYVFKPAVMLALITVAISADPMRASVRDLVVLALVAGLLGDVALMLEHKPGEDPSQRRSGGPRFFAGLIAFFVGHVFYVLAMARLAFDWLGAGMGAVLALLVLLAFGFNVLRGAKASGGLGLAAAVLVYMTALGALLVFGIATAQVFVTYGCIVFVASDLFLGTARFVRPHPLSRIAVTVTYHVAQAMLVVGLVR